MRRLIRPSFLTALLLLAAVEFFLRCTLSPLAVAAFQCGYHPDAGFQETTAGLVQLVPGPTRDFHAQSFARVPPPGGCRIFTLGSSVEYWDAEASHILSNTYPARLGEELRRGGLNAESINLGVTGYGSRRNEVLLHKALTYQPSLIILKLDTTNEGVDEKTAERQQAFISFWPQDLLWKSYLIQSGLKLKEDRLLSHTLPQKMLAWTASHPAATTAATSPFNTASRQTIERCLQFCRAQRVPVLLVTQAYKGFDAAGHATITDQGLDAFAAQLCGPGVTMFSLKQFLTPLPIQETFVDHVHLARPVHQLLAHALAAVVPTLVSANP